MTLRAQLFPPHFEEERVVFWPYRLDWGKRPLANFDFQIDQKINNFTKKKNVFHRENSSGGQLQARFLILFSFFGLAASRK